MIGMLITVLVHELGHLLFGLVSGYRFLAITVFGLTLSRVGGKLRFSHSGLFLYGQCLMYPVKKDADPRLVIAGGVLMNLLMVVLNTAAVVIGLSHRISAEAELLMMFCCELVIFNLMGFIGNLICGSRTSDGATLKEVRSDRDNCLCYNNIMLLTKEYAEGHRTGLRTEEFLSPATRVRSGLASELRDMLMECGRSEDDRTYI